VVVHSVKTQRKEVHPNLVQEGATERNNRYKDPSLNSRLWPMKKDKKSGLC